MGLPAKKRPKSEKRKRRAAKRMQRLTLSLCSYCQKPVLPHCLCSFCGTYKGREFVSLETKKQGRQKKE